MDVLPGRTGPFMRKNENLLRADNDHHFGAGARWFDEMRGPGNTLVAEYDMLRPDAVVKLLPS
jgi:hypothetical protein